MADTLDAIVENTEAASNNILESMEAIDGMVGDLRGKNDPEMTRWCDRATDHINQVFEACSFQDLTGQRITRIVKALKFLEERVDAVVRMWGLDELKDVIEDIKAEKTQQPKSEDVELQGPQRPGAGISQDAVDQLFSQDDIDKLFG
jgi:chemotaxis protein CheZ